MLTRTTTDVPSPILDSRGPDPQPALPAADGHTSGTDWARQGVDLNVSLVVDGGHATMWLAGQIDAARRDEVYEIGALAIAEPRVDALVLDLAQVSFVDAAGLGVLVQLRNFAARAGTRLALRAVPPSVSKLLMVTNLGKAFGVPVGDAGRC